MPIYEYQCPRCEALFEELMSISEMEKTEFIYSPCCNMAGIRQFAVSQILIKGAYKIKAKEQKRIDDGIPFGEVPGDMDYENINSPFSPKP